MNITYGYRLNYDRELYAVNAYVEYFLYAHRLTKRIKPNKHSPIMF